MNDFPRTLKLATVWLLIGLLLFLGVQWWQARQQAARFSFDGTEVLLRRAPDGHFHWPGQIAGRRLDFLVDTGATTTALPAALAAQLRLTPEGAVQSSTAGGLVQGARARADLELDGGVRVQGLKVVLLPALDAPLLGMDVLGRLRFQQEAGVLRVSR
jgi:aspartyl protease family protein